MKIAIDGMGGDNAPVAIIEGAKNALSNHQDLEILMVISKEAAEEHLNTVPDRMEIIYSGSVMAMDEAVENLRRKKDSSIFLATKAVADGEADAVVSCGSTAAQFAAAILLIGRIKGVKRPAILIPYPTLKGSLTMLDGGAGVDPEPRDLLCYGKMGSVYHRLAKGVENPKVALLSNGTESHKGTALVREAYQLLESDDSIDFIGNVEGRDVMSGDFDVLVTDGFTGNVVMKVTEGVGSGLFKLIKKELTATTTRKIGAALVKPGLKEIAKLFDYNQYGGMPLLGVKGLSIVCHGSSGPEAVENGIVSAMNFHNLDFIHELENSIS